MQQHNSAADLLRARLIRIAEEPPANHRRVEGLDCYTMPLLAADYPAKTAVMWNAVYERFLMPDRNIMVVADPKDAGPILETFRRDPLYRGGGAGIGFKEAVLPHLDDVTPFAQAIGAVNIIKRNHRGQLLGDNTDGPGYAAALENEFTARGALSAPESPAKRGGEDLGGKKVLVLGAGGSAKAIAFALAAKGAELVILNRTPAKAEELAGRINAHLGKASAAGGGREMISSILPEQDAVVSAIDDEASPLDVYSTLGAMALVVSGATIAANRLESAELLKQAKPGLVVSDIRIRRWEMPMLRQARGLGFRTLDGIPMVVNQAIEAFWWIYGSMPHGCTKEEVAAIMRQAAAQS